MKKNKITRVKKAIKSQYYISSLKKNYSIVNRNVISFGYRTFDNFNSELLLFKRI